MERYVRGEENDLLLVEIQEMDFYYDSAFLHFEDAQLAAVIFHVALNLAEAVFELFNFLLCIIVFGRWSSP